MVKARWLARGFDSGLDTGGDVGIQRRSTYLLLYHRDAAPGINGVITNVGLNFGGSNPDYEMMCTLQLRLSCHYPGYILWCCSRPVW